MQTLRRILRFGVQHYLRNGWLSLAATLMVAMTLFVVSVFALQSYVIKSETQSIQDKLDMAIYISDAPSEEDVQTFVQQVKAIPDVRDVTYLNKDQVITEWNKLPVGNKIKSEVNAENNPLPRTVKLKAGNPESLDSIAAAINQTPLAQANNIRNMSYRNNRTVIQQLIAQSKKVKRNGLIVSGIFSVIAVLFIFNTIRIIIRFRQEEIAIMKLVGATDSFVRGPFIIEGSLYGLVAGLITLIALYFYLQNGLSEGASSLSNTSPVISQELFALFQAHIIIIAAVLIGSAMFVSALCSWASLQRHLKG
jgi:cell division transport system permease protein